MAYERAIKTGRTFSSLPAVLVDLPTLYMVALTNLLRGHRVKFVRKLLKTLATSHSQTYQITFHGMSFGCVDMRKVNEWCSKRATNPKTLRACDMADFISLEGNLHILEVQRSDAETPPSHGITKANVGFGPTAFSICEVTNYDPAGKQIGVDTTIVPPAKLPSGLSASFYSAIKTLPFEMVGIVSAALQFSDTFNTYKSTEQILHALPVIQPALGRDYRPFGPPTGTGAGLPIQMVSMTDSVMKVMYDSTTGAATISKIGRPAENNDGIIGAPAPEVVPFELRPIGTSGLMSYVRVKLVDIPRGKGKGKGKKPTSAPIVEDSDDDDIPVVSPAPKKPVKRGMKEKLNTELHLVELKIDEAREAGTDCTELTDRRRVLMQRIAARKIKSKQTKTPLTFAVSPSSPKQLTRHRRPETEIMRQYLERTSPAAPKDHSALAKERHIKRMKREAEIQAEVDRARAKRKAEEAKVKQAEEEKQAMQRKIEFDLAVQQRSEASADGAKRKADSLPAADTRLVFGELGLAAGDAERLKRRKTDSDPADARQPELTKDQAELAKDQARSAEELAKDQAAGVVKAALAADTGAPGSPVAPSAAAARVLPVSRPVSTEPVGGIKTLEAAPMDEDDTQELFSQVPGC